MNYFCKTMLPALLLALLSATTVRAEDDFAKDILGGIFQDFGEVFKGELSKEVADSRRKRELEKSAIRERGFCQIWTSDVLKTQKSCEHQYYCEDGNVCTHKYLWPKKSVTQVQSQGGVPITLNGYKTLPALVGSDECMEDGSESVFCFTRRKQTASLRVKRVDDLGEQQQVAKEPDLSDLNSENRIEELPSSTSVEPSQAQPKSSSASEDLMQQFVTEVERGDIPEAKQNRCAIGRTLITVYGEKIDSEMKSLISQRMQVDGCA